MNNEIINKTLKFELDRANQKILEITDKVLTLHGNFRYNTYTQQEEYHLDYSSRKLIKDYEVRDHGVENSQYFQGCGISFTRFDHCATGCGSEHALEAIKDAIDILAQDGYEVTELLDQILDDYNWSKLELKRTLVHEDCHSCDCDLCHEHDDCELYYYFSILVR